MLIDEEKLVLEYNNLLKKQRFRLFTMFSMPTGWFAGLRVVQLDDNVCLTSLPGGWRTQNPFKTMYWAVQGMGAELSTGASTFAISKSMSEKLRMFVVSTEAKFTKTAKGKITFTCEENSIARAAIEESKVTGRPVECNLTSIATDSSGDIVSEWIFKWNFLVISGE
ncbi:MAG: DUF4442 domain-containing protein [Candidatus Poseidoniales archaeon]